MEINDVLKRINELAHKKKSGQELTEAELVEKKELYLIRQNWLLMKQSVPNIVSLSKNVPASSLKKLKNWAYHVYLIAAVSS